jgi:uncharacterized protein (DUF1786 family)
MDHQALPQSSIDLGARILDAVDEFGLQPEGAFWFFDEESSEWRFHIVSSLVDVAGPRWMFIQLNKILPEIVDQLPPAFDLHLVSANEVLADEVRLAAENSVDDHDEPAIVDFGNGKKNLVVYRIRPTMSVRALHRTRVEFRKKLKEAAETRAA